MARRSTVQHDPRIAGDPELSAYPEFDQAPPGVRRGAKRGGWSGGGGRWLVWTGRAILWALIVVIVVNGVRAPFERFTESGAPAANVPAATGQAFPSERASAFATQFASIYLNMKSEELDTRSRQLAPYLQSDEDPQFGWDGYGRMFAANLQPFGVEVVDSNNGVVTLAFQSGARRFLLSVPVYYSGGRFVVSGRPALLPAPAPADLPQVAQPEGDEAAEAELRPQLQGFFKAYADGSSDLSRYLVAGKSLPSFGGAFTFVELKSVVVPVGGATREIQAVVVWGVPTGATPSATPGATDPSAVSGRLEQAYRLTVEKQGDKWYVEDIRGAGRAVG